MYSLLDNFEIPLIRLLSFGNKFLLANAAFASTCCLFDESILMISQLHGFVNRSIGYKNLLAKGWL